MLPTPDARWAAMFEINSYEEYLNRVSERIYLKPTVDEDVKSIFKLVQRLIDLAYYEYELIDLACMKALLALELALKKRYQQVKTSGSPDPKKWKLKNYMTWFFQNGCFETDSMDFLDQIRSIRNHFAHPEYHSFGGTITSWHIPAATGLINDLYEDSSLRAARKQEIINFNQAIQEITKGGALLDVTGHKSELVYLFICGFINNKTEDKLYHWIYKPLFNIPREYSKKDSFQTGRTFYLSCHFIQLFGNKLTGFDKNGDKIFHLSGSPTDHKEELISWYQQYKAYLQELPHFTLVDNNSIGTIIANLLFEFYKT